jgi:uncharacterized protein (DUF58 family)
VFPEKRRVRMNDRADSFIDEDFLKRLENLKILTGRVIRGVERGEHISWRSGPSLEFLDSRKYQTGDDFRYVDWNVYGRLDKLFIKLFRAEESQRIHILIDASASMGKGRPPKDIFAKKIAATISYICLANLDNVSVTAFSDRLSDNMVPVRSRLAYSKLLNHLQKIHPGGKTDFNACLSTYAATSKRSGIAVILTDLMDPKGYREGLEALHHTRFDTALIQVLDHSEIYPSDMGNLILKEIEEGVTKLITVDRTMLDLYQKKIREYVAGIKEYCTGWGMDYYLCDTALSFEDQLLDYLTQGRLFQ